MVAWFADRPFRLASKFMLKASAPTKAWYEQHRARGQPVDKILARLMQAKSRHSNGVRYPFEIETVAPRANGRFNGRVWVLVNRHSYSNSASVAALIRIIGLGPSSGKRLRTCQQTTPQSCSSDCPTAGTRSTIQRAILFDLMGTRPYAELFLTFAFRESRSAWKRMSYSTHPCRVSVASTSTG